MAVREDKLGEICIRSRVATPAQLNFALHLQKRQVNPQHLGDMLVDLGFVSRATLRKVIEESGHRELFGEMLVHQGVLTTEQLDEALRSQKGSGRRLGEILVEMDLLDDEKLARALGRQLDIAYVVPTLHAVDPEVFRRLHPDFIRKKHIIPASEENGSVTVWVADPAERALRSSLKGVLETDVELAVGMRTSIDALIDELLLRERFRKHSLGREVAAAALEPPAEKMVINSRDITTRDPSSATAIFDYLVWDALKQRASDIHIEPHRNHLRVRYRVDGMLVTHGEFPLALGELLAKRAVVLARLRADSLEKQREGLIQAEVDHKLVDLRLAISQSVLGPAITIRLSPHDTGLMNLATLGMPPRMLSTYISLAEHSSGLTLFAAPKGCGKTTSMYATIQHLNDGTRKIVTVESPVAFILDGLVQHNVPTEGYDSMGTIMVSLLQVDPDVIALSEQAVACACEDLLRAAGMGQRTFAAMHADDSVTALLQLAQDSSFLSLARSCEIVILSQRLVRQNCTGCARPALPRKGILREFPYMESIPDGVRLSQGSGCPACRGTGYLGRTGIFELLVVGPEIREALDQRATVQEVRRMVQKESSFLSLKQAGFLKACQGMTTLDEVRRVLSAVELESYAEHANTFQDLCRKAGLDFDKDGKRM